MSIIKDILKISKSFIKTFDVFQIPKIANNNLLQIHTTTGNNGLMEFFDDEKNWGQNEVKTGRSWRKEELRLKSNSDLHKLWYILLKERNLLLTMEYESKQQMRLFPNPERLDKVKESMENLEDVVRDRNKAYHLLETGETGERPGKVTQNVFGLRYYYRMGEHVIPKFMNTSWRRKMYFYQSNAAVSKFLRLYREKLWNEKRKKNNRDFGHVVQLIKRFPNLDLDAVKEQYPNVDLEKAKNHKKARGHSVPK